MRFMMGISAELASGIIQDTEDRNLAGGATTAFALSLAAEVTLVGLDLAGQGRGLVQPPGDNLAQTMVKIGRRDLVDAGQIGRRAGRHFSDEELKQTALLFFR